MLGRKQILGVVKTTQIRKTMMEMDFFPMKRIKTSIFIITTKFTSNIVMELDTRAIMKSHFYIKVTSFGLGDLLIQMKLLTMQWNSWT